MVVARAELNHGAISRACGAISALYKTHGFFTIIPATARVVYHRLSEAAMEYSAVSGAAKKAFDPTVISRLAHVLWRIENATMIKTATKEQRIAAWNREKRPHLEKARKIIDLADSVEFTAKP